MKQIAIYGASGHGKVIADIAKLDGYRDIILIDDKEYSGSISFEEFLHKYNKVPVIIGVGNNYTRAKLYQQCIDHHLKITTLIHPSAVIAEGVFIGKGTVVMAGVVANTGAAIGRGCILNTASVIEHDNHIGDFVHISPQVACAGDVTIGAYTHIGIGSCIIQGITIGQKSMIGAGSAVVRDIPSHVLAYGNPCKIIKDLNR